MLHVAGASLTATGLSIHQNINRLLFSEHIHGAYFLSVNEQELKIFFDPQFLWISLWKT